MWPLFESATHARASHRRRPRRKGGNSRFQTPTKAFPMWGRATKEVRQPRGAGPNGSDWASAGTDTVRTDGLPRPRARSARTRKNQHRCESSLLSGFQVSGFRVPGFQGVVKSASFTGTGWSRHPLQSEKFYRSIAQGAIKDT
jgi:hypothetical protein